MIAMWLEHKINIFKWQGCNTVSSLKIRPLYLFGTRILTVK